MDFNGNDSSLDIDGFVGCELSPQEELKRLTKVIDNLTAEFQLSFREFIRSKPTCTLFGFQIRKAFLCLNLKFLVDEAHFILGG